MCTRVLTLGDGAQLVEETGAEEGDGLRYSYKILSGPLAVADYVATLSAARRNGARWCTGRGRSTARA